MRRSIVIHNGLRPRACDNSINCVALPAMQLMPLCAPASTEFLSGFRKKIGSLAVAGLVVLATLMSPFEGSKAPQGV